MSTLKLPVRTGATPEMASSDALQSTIAPTSVPAEAIPKVPPLASMTETPRDSNTPRELIAMLGKNVEVNLVNNNSRYGILDVISKYILVLNVGTEVAPRPVILMKTAVAFV